MLPPSCSVQCSQFWREKALQPAQRIAVINGPKEVFHFTVCWVCYWCRSENAKGFLFSAAGALLFARRRRTFSKGKCSEILPLTLAEFQRHPFQRGRGKVAQFQTRNAHPTRANINTCNRFTHSHPLAHKHSFVRRNRSPFEAHKSRPAKNQWEFSPFNTTRSIDLTWTHKLLK